MGDMADDLVDGVFDFYTGEYIGHGVGYPRSVYFKDERKRKNPKSGITKYMVGKGITDKQLQIELIRNFFVNEDVTQISRLDLCQKIQKRFGEFVKYLKPHFKK